MRAFGFPWPEGASKASPSQRTRAPRCAERATRSSRSRGSRRTARCSRRLRPNPSSRTTRLSRELASGAHVILGAADARLRAAADATAVTLHEYEGDEELMLLRGPAIVEGALQVAIANTARHDPRFVRHASSDTARSARYSHARSSCSARTSPSPRATRSSGPPRAQPGQRRRRSTRCPSSQPDSAMLVSTVPAPVVGRDVLDRHGARFAGHGPGRAARRRRPRAASELGLVAVWARGLGRRAPVTVGASQWRGIRKRIQAIEEERP